MSLPWIYLGAAGVSSWLIASRFDLRRPARVLVGLVLFAGFEILPVQLVAGLQLAGIVERVELAPLTVLQVAVTAGIGLLISRLGTPKRRAAERARIGTLAGLPAYVLFASAIVAGSYLIFAANLLSSFPDGWDALAYHIPLSLRWLQDGSLAIPASGVWQYSLPGNAEIGMMIMLASGREEWIPWVNGLALSVLAVSVFHWVREWTDETIAAYLVVLLVLSLPITQYQTFSGYVDLFGTSFLIAAAALFLEWRRNQAASVLAVSALACGISLGTKPVFYVYAAAYAVAVAIYLGCRRSRLPVWRLSTLLVAGMMLPAAFWFARGLVAKGNPVYPLQVKIGERVLLPGYSAKEIMPEDYDLDFVRSKAEWLIHPWTEWKRTQDFLLIPYSPGNGVGAAFATFVPLGLAFAFYAGFVKERGVWNGRKALLILWVILGVIWWFALRRMPRFGFPIVVLACVASSALLTVFVQQGRFLFRALLIVSLLSTCVISSFRPLHTMLSRLRSSRADYYGYPAVIDRLPPGSRVLNMASHTNNFAFAGDDLTNRVIPFFEAPEVLTREYLRRQGVDFVIEKPRTDDSMLDVPGGSVFYEGTLPLGEGNWERWRIWATRQTE